MEHDAPSPETHVIVYQAPWNWDVLWNRAQPLARALSKHATVIYVEAGTRAPELSRFETQVNRISFVRRLLWRRRPGRLIQLGPNLYYYNEFALSKWHANEFAMTTADREPIQYEYLARSLSQFLTGQRVAWLLTSRPFADRLLSLHKWDCIVADLEDPWLTVCPHHTREQIVEFFRKVDAITANGDMLATEYNPLSDKAILPLYNGVDEEFVRQVSERHDVLPPYFLARPDRPRAVFTGTVNNRIDLDSLYTIVRACPGIDFHFFGLIRAEDITKWERLLSAENFAFHGSVPHEALPKLICHASVLLLPYTDLSNYFPAKLLEYIVTGKPIVSFADYSQQFATVPTLYACSTVDEYAATLRSIVDSNAPLSEEQRGAITAIASEHSWNRRAKEMVEVFRSHEPRSIK